MASSSLWPSEEWLDCLRDPLGRAAEEERLCPAFWRVFCRVISFSVRSPSNSGLAWTVGVLEDSWNGVSW
jgi:hypothetical protein